MIDDDTVLLTVDHDGKQFTAHAERVDGTKVLLVAEKLWNDLKRNENIAYGRDILLIPLRATPRAMLAIKKQICH